MAPTPSMNTVERRIVKWDVPVDQRVSLKR